MFTIKIEKDGEDFDVCLSFKSDSFSMSFSPEDSECPEIADSGSFEAHPCNGNCSFEWNSDAIKFNLAKYGDGQGGDLSITIKNTPEIMSSLKDCLNQWNEAASQ